MNPDTKLTDEQLMRLCDRHHIVYGSHHRINTGFTHEVHRLNDDLVIKLFNGDSSQRYKTERALLASDRPFRKPRLVANAENDPELGRSYIVMTYVPGLSLGSHWHEANDEQREKLVADICTSLKVINGIEPVEISLESTDTWPGVVTKRANNLVAKLRKRGTIDEASANRVLRVFERDRHVPEGTEILPVYWDIHFDNFIVNEQFELQALIDLENVEITSLDYPLFVIQKQTDEPEKYLREEDEQFADKRDYTKLKGWYKKYYPEMFAFDDLPTRVKLYQLLDTLHLLIDWSHVRELYTKLDLLTS